MSAARRRLAALAAEFEAARPIEGEPPEGQTAHLPAQTSRDDLSPGRHRADERVRQVGYLQLTSQHLAVLALGLAALIAVAAWWSLRSSPSSEPVPVATRSATTSGGPLVSASSTAVTPVGPVISVQADPSPQPPAVVVDVTGRVRKPGIVELPAGSRVVDALAAAGGARPGIDTRGLNLARLLVDGEQIVVGARVPVVPPPAGAAPVAPPSGEAPATGALRVNLNTATQEQLEALPGIGPVTAASILTWRSENGPFTQVDQLLDVSGIGDATLADLEPYVYV